MFERIRRMFIKEFLQMFRDPRMRIVIFGVPLIQLVIMAFAMTMDVTDIKTAVIDQDNTVASREVTRRFTAGGYFEVVEYADSLSDVTGLLDTGSVQALIRIPSGFEKDLRGGGTARVQLIADGTDSNTTSIVMGYASQIMTLYRAEILKERIKSIAGGAASPPQIEIETRAWFNKNLESRYYYVPGLIAIMLILVSMMVASIAIVREKEGGTIEQVMVTPIRKVEFILGKTVPYLITGYIVMTMMFIIAMIIFGVRIQGSIVLLYFLTGIYLAGNLGLALLISVSAHTQQQALLTAFFILMPAVLLSGFIFPIDNMPVPVQYATYLNPMRWYMEIIRGVVMKGVGIVALTKAIIAQAILAALFLMVATKRFKKTLE
ncbi:MAG TPA: ABC transporter permease [Deltaproteobacteria bacterium]|nr:ABC transporter permease [Deltaproteobacteria bacterium]